MWLRPSSCVTQLVTKLSFVAGGISRKALNGSSVADVLPPNKIEQFAENLTETLVPEMPDLDLTKYMGRWFEGIDSPRATSQRCVVHHCEIISESSTTIRS